MKKKRNPIKKNNGKNGQKTPIFKKKEQINKNTVEF